MEEKNSKKDFKVSVVITAYNVEKYIEKAIKSVFNQTYKNIEIIVVEDQSTDSTKNILKEYEKDYKSEVTKDFHVVWNKENVGAGLSRRYGIQNATGEFVMLLDADDWLKEDYIEKLVKNQQETDADIVSGGISYYFEDDDKFEITTYGTHVSEGMQKFTDYSKGKIVFLNNKIVRKSMYDKVEYCDRRYVEDTPVIMKLLYYANKVSYVNEAGYNYLQRNGSLCHSNSTWKHQLYCAVCCAELIEWFKDKEKEYSKIFQLPQFISYLKNMSKLPVSKEDYEENGKELLTCFNYLLNNINLH